MRVLAVGTDFDTVFVGLLLLGKSSVTEKKILDLKEVCIYMYTHLR